MSAVSCDVLVVGLGPAGGAAAAAAAKLGLRVVGVEKKRVVGVPVQPNALPPNLCRLADLNEGAGPTAEASRSADLDLDALLGGGPETRRATGAPVASLKFVLWTVDQGAGTAK